MKKQRLCYVKSIDSKEKAITAYVSDFKWDRTDERFAKGTWDTANYERNPVVLWAHNSKILPIAKTVAFIEDEIGLMKRMVFDDKQPFAMDVFGQYERGFLNAFSVGFIPEFRSMKVESIEGTDRKGIVWTRAELLESSAVPIPANPGAVVSRGFAEFLQKSLPDDHIVEALGGDEFQLKKEAYLKYGNPSTQPDATSSLKTLVEMAKVAQYEVRRGKEKVDQTQLSLINEASQVLHEIFTDNLESLGLVSKGEMNELKQNVIQLCDVVQKQRPDYRKIIAQIMNGIEAAVKTAGTGK